MTPLEMQAALYYYWTGSTERYDPQNHAPVVLDATRMLVDRELVAMTFNQGDQRPHYRKTDGLELYVTTLMAVPLPQLTWTMPS